MKLLLNDKLAPITSEIGFVEADCGRTAQAFLGWQSAVLAKHGISPRYEPMGTPSIEETLRRLLPLTTIQPRRALFMATNSVWTAYFDNSAQGTDAFPPMSHLARELRCRALRVVSIPYSLGKKDACRKRYGATILEVYGAEDKEFLNYERSLCVASDERGWRFDQAGSPLPFEDLSSYQARAVRDRFSHERLTEYLRALGLRAFEESFYRPEVAILVERLGTVPANLKELSLEEVQSEFLA